MDEVNPFIAPRADGRSLEAQTRDCRKLGWFGVFVGLTIVGSLFGACFTTCIVMAHHFSLWAGPAGVPISASEAITLLASIGLFGLVGAVFATPLLVICNQRRCLEFWSATGSIATIGTIVFLIFVGSADPNRVLPPFGARATNMLIVGFLVWISSLVAAVAYGLWICHLQRRTGGHSSRMQTPTHNTDISLQFASRAPDPG